jgi:ABC-2 type transport system ATP-binding protein
MIVNTNTTPLKIKSLTKAYGPDRGVKDINLELKTGEVFGFLGPNGAGKTTTIRLILDFIRPDQGTIEIFGLDSIIDTSRAKEKIGYLAGDIALYNDLTGQQFLEYLTSIGKNTNWALVKKLTHDLQADLNRKIKDLSKGNRQKIGLIQAFMHQPELIILDEPTSGLDPLMQGVFYQMVKAATENNQTVFLSSHNLGEVQRICHRAGFIREGKLIAVNDISKTNDIALHKLIIGFNDIPKITEFKSIPGVKDVNINNKILTISIKGSINPLVKELAKHSVVSIETQETTLEETFMHYYQGGDHA